MAPSTHRPRRHPRYRPRRRPRHHPRRLGCFLRLVLKLFPSGGGASWGLWGPRGGFWGVGNTWPQSCTPKVCVFVMYILLGSSLENFIFVKMAVTPERHDLLSWALPNSPLPTSSLFQPSPSLVPVFQIFPSPRLLSGLPVTRPLS